MGPRPFLERAVDVSTRARDPQIPQTPQRQTQGGFLATQPVLNGPW